MGISGYTISLALSFIRLINAISQTVRGKAHNVRHMEKTPFGE
jgi:hypothetical protein